MAVWPYNTKRWAELRAQKLQITPRCELCPPGVDRRATCVDHKQSVRHGGDPFPALGGLMSLCWSCHSAKTARGVEAGAVRSSSPAMKAVGIDGMPIDPKHPCYKP